MSWSLLLVSAAAALAPAASPDPGPHAPHSAAVAEPCQNRDFVALRRNPDESELRCRYQIVGPGRFGLLSYVDVPVYQPDTPMPGTHLVGMSGHARPIPGESFEAWEWRVLRTGFGPDVHKVHRELELLDPMVAARIMRLERRLAEEGIRAVRRETWRSPDRQAYLFQQGRSRPGPLATATLTSWHAQVDGSGNPAGRAVDYNVSAAAMERFHELAEEAGLSSFGHDSNDPGHVFLPDAQELPSVEIVLLRTLPRVPEVTLATGLPVDKPLPPGGAAHLAQASAAFAEADFIRFVPARMSPGPHADIVRATRASRSDQVAVGDADDLAGEINR